MHSRIYQLTKEPIYNDEWLTEADLYDTSFIGEIADYVSTQPEEEREEDIEWFLQGKEKVFAREGDKLTLLPGAKHAYFAKRYNKFKEKIANFTLDDFCNNYKVWESLNILRDTFSFYVYTDEGGWKPLDTFIRESVEGDVFYIGGIVDYHF